MPKPGPKRTVSDDRLILELYIAGESVFATEIEDHVDLKTVQSVRDRLNQLEQNTEYVKMKKVSNRNLYSLTPSGEEYLLELLRETVD